MHVHKGKLHIKNEGPNVDRPTDTLNRRTKRPPDQQTDMRFHMEVTLPKRQ